LKEFKRDGGFIIIDYGLIDYLLITNEVHAAAKSILPIFSDAIKFSG